jgi:hypothetical protein
MGRLIFTEWKKLNKGTDFLPFALSVAIDFGF